MQKTQTWAAKLIENGRTSAVEIKRRLDSWANTLTGLGTGRDKTTHMLPRWVQALSPLELEVLYATDDIATRIVRTVVDEALRGEWNIVPEEESSAAPVVDPNERNDDGRAAPAAAGGGDDGDGPRRLKQRMKELDGWRKFHDAWVWGRLYGKGALLLGADDGQDWSEPLDVERVTAFNFITVLDRRDLTPFEWYADLQDDKFGQIATYYVQPVGVYMGTPYDGIATNPPVLVHESRLVIFGGELTNKRQRLANQGCDYSVLQKCFRALQLTNNNWQSASTLLADAGQGVFKIRGLIDMIAQNPDLMQSRMALVDMMRSTVRAIILDAGDERSKTPPEDFTRVATPFTGIPEMLRETWNRLACAAEMPLWKLMGSSPGSLQGSEEEGQEDWYNQVESQQHHIAKPALTYILTLIAKAEGIDGQWTAVPPPLRRMSQPQQAKAMADLSVWAKNIIESGAMMQEEVALSLAKDPSGNTLVIDAETRKKMLATSFKAAEDEKKMVDKELKAPAMPPGGAKPAPKKTP